MKRMLLSLVAVLGLSSAMLADTPKPEVGGDQSPAKQLTPQPQASVKEVDKAWSFTGGVDVQSKYIFRGFTTTKSGFIAQPYGQLSLKIYDQNDVTVSPYIGTWNNVTSHPFVQKNGGKTNNLRFWLETDIDVGAVVTFKKFTVAFNYIYYLYPNGSIGEDQEVGVNVGYDDSDLWANNTLLSAVNPHVAYYHEIRNQAGPEGSYIELGVEPTFKTVNFGKLPVTFSVPTNVGLTYDRYYTNNRGGSETFGYVQVGVKATLPVAANVSLVGEVDYWHLNAANIRSLNGGKQDDVTARVGLTFKL